jgi:hypothetical protein
MITYPDLIKLYGTPVSKIPLPYYPYRYKKGFAIAGVCIFVLGIYIGYKIQSGKNGDKPSDPNNKP